jgi:hypothetical protein
MRTHEFIEYMGKNVNRTLKEEQVLALVQKQLEVKKYIPIKEKKELVDKIIYHSAYFEDGILKINAIDCYMYFTMFTIDAYTNLEIDNVENCFDALSESGLMPAVIAALGQEYSDVNTFLNMKRDEMLADNSIENQVGKFLDKISREVDGVKGAITDAIGGLNINKEDVIKLVKLFVQ